MEKVVKTPANVSPLPSSVTKLMNSSVKNSLIDQSAFVTSKLNKIDDLLMETFNQKQNLTEANQEYLDRYLEVFKEKVQIAK